ncbi:MAG: hypothetical protein ACH350_06405 [Parachlamydiaceae bacterium]
MRTAFKKAAKDNTDILHKYLGEFLEGTWSLARKSTDVIDSYRVRIKTEGKELDSTLVLRNIISDLCCCLDSLERGGCRTIDNNLRMSFEDYCCALQLHADPKAYALFLKEDLDVPKAVTFAKKQRQGYEDFGQLYGHFSSISHHSRLILLARQVVSIENDMVCYAHLKPINPTKLTAQISRLIFIAFLLIEIGVLAEEICLDLVDTPYFGIKTPEGYQKRFDTPEALFILKLAARADSIFNPPTCL